MTFLVLRLVPVTSSFMFIVCILGEKSRLGVHKCTHWKSIIWLANQGEHDPAGKELRFPLLTVREVH